MMKTKHAKPASLLMLFALLAGGALGHPASSQRAAGARDEEVVRGSLSDVRGFRRIALLVSRALVVDAREPALVALEDYRRAVAGSPPRTHGAAARQIANKLNKYIRKYRMATAAQEVAGADLVIIFKVIRQRASAIPTEPHVWGKMYVLAVGADRRPRIVWESEGEYSAVEDATDDFLKAFRAARGER